MNFQILRQAISKWLLNLINRSWIKHLFAYDLVIIKSENVNKIIPKIYFLHFWTVKRVEKLISFLHLRAYRVLRNHRWIVSEPNSETYSRSVYDFHGWTVKGSKNNMTTFKQVVKCKCNFLEGWTKFNRVHSTQHPCQQNITNKLFCI